jgi:hypothetical protein
MLSVTESTVAWVPNQSGAMDRQSQAMSRVISECWCRRSLYRWVRGALSVNVASGCCPAVPLTSFALSYARSRVSALSIRAHVLRHVREQSRREEDPA